MIEATLTLAALTPLACYAAWRAGYARGLSAAHDEHPNATDWRNRCERAEADLAELRAKMRRVSDERGRFVRREQ